VGLPSNTMWPGPRPTSIPSGISIHPAIWHGPRIEEGAVPLLGAAGSPTNTMLPGLRPTSIPSGILIIQLFDHNRHGPKMGGGAFALFWGELGPHLTVSPGPRSSSVQVAS